MLPTVWLIIGAVTFGTLLEEFGMIARLVDPLIRAARTTGRLFATVFACAFGLNVVAGDQYIALILPTKVFRAEFARRDLAPTNLSRLAADSGTVTSPLVPWNSCGAFMGAVLGVSALQYLPYALFNIASPALSVVCGFTGFRIEHLPGQAVAEQAPGRSRRERDLDAGRRADGRRGPAGDPHHLTAMVVGGMVGAGVFSLPAASQPRPRSPALVAWAIAGTGMLMLAFVFQTLAIRKPDLDSGVYAYAKAGFGEYLGFFSAFGYWASACVGNVTYWVLIMSTVGGIVPALGEGDTARRCCCRPPASGRSPS